MTDKNKNDPRAQGFTVGQAAQDEYAAEQAERQNDPLRPEGLQKPSAPQGQYKPRPSFPVGEAAKAEYAAEQERLKDAPIRPEGLQKPSGRETAVNSPPAPGKEMTRGVDPSPPTTSPSEPVMIHTGVDSLSGNIKDDRLNSPAGTPETIPAAMPEITQEASAALQDFQQSLMTELGLKGNNEVEIAANYLASGFQGDIANGKAAGSLVEKLQDGQNSKGEPIDPATRQKIIEAINDPARREAALGKLLDEVKKDHNVLTRYNENPEGLLALTEKPAPAPVALAAAPVVNPFPDVEPPKDPLQASYYDPQWGPGSAAAVMPPSPPPESGHVSSDPVTQDVHRPAAAASAAAVPASPPAAPAETPHVATEETLQLRKDIGTALADLLKDDDARKLLDSAMKDHDVALFVGRQIGIELDEFGNENGSGLDTDKVKAKLEAMPDDELKAAKENIAAGKKYIEENRLKVQAFNGMPEAAQHSLATGANALSGFQDKMSEMGNNFMGGLMKNLGSVFNGGQFNIGNLFNGIDIGGMFKQIMGMITGMVSSFSGSESMKGLSNMGGQMMSQLSETLAPVTGQKPGEVVAYNQDGAKIGTPGQPAPGGTAQRRPNDPNAAPNGPGGTTPTG